MITQSYTKSHVISRNFGALDRRFCLITGWTLLCVSFKPLGVVVSMLSHAGRLVKYHEIYTTSASFCEYLIDTFLPWLLKECKMQYRNAFINVFFAVNVSPHDNFVGAVWLLSKWQSKTRNDFCDIHIILKVATASMVHVFSKLDWFSCGVSDLLALRPDYSERIRLVPRLRMPWLSEAMILIIQYNK